MHRLDKDTTGVLLISLNDSVHRRLSDLFAHGGIEKRYWAVGMGLPKPEAGSVRTDLEKKFTDRHWRFTASPNLPNGSCIFQESGANTLDDVSAKAHTNFRVLSHNGIHASLLELRPLTGRQHQLRVHCAEVLQAPILGDALYGPRITPYLQSELRPHLVMSVIPMHLHAFEIVLPVGATRKTEKKPQVIRAPVPSYFKITLHVLGLRDVVEEEVAKTSKAAWKRWQRR